MGDDGWLRHQCSGRRGSRSAGRGSVALSAEKLKQRASANLESYHVNAPLLKEQVNIELAAAEGGYGRRQLYELIQNGADALLPGGGGQIQVVLTNDAFYCANEGDPIDVEGVRAILLRMSRRSAATNRSLRAGLQIGPRGHGQPRVLQPLRLVRMELQPDARSGRRGR